MLVKQAIKQFYDSIPGELGVYSKQIRFLFPATFLRYVMISDVVNSRIASICLVERATVPYVDTTQSRVPGLESLKSESQV